MIFKSSGNLVNPNIVTYRSLGFGEAAILDTQAYELIINPCEFPEEFMIYANKFIAECRIDDAEQGYSDIPALEKINYPTFSELLKNHENLATNLIKDYLYFELFYHLFPNSENLKLVINNIKDVHTEGKTIVISGDTYPYKKNLTRPN